MTLAKEVTLSKQVETALAHYFDSLKGEMPVQLHKMVICEVERALFKAVMQRAQGNQSQAAKMLGINRNTLRARLDKYKLNIPTD